MQQLVVVENIPAGVTSFESKRHVKPRMMAIAFYAFKGFALQARKSVRSATGLA